MQKLSVAIYRCFLPGLLASLHLFLESCRWSWHTRWGFEQQALLKGAPAHGRGVGIGSSLKSLPIKSSYRFYDSVSQWFTLMIFQINGHCLHFVFIPMKLTAPLSSCMFLSVQSSRKKRLYVPCRSRSSLFSDQATVLGRATMLRPYVQSMSGICIIILGSIWSGLLFKELLEETKHW